MELPTTGAADQLRQVIEGKLETNGHEAINVQVLLKDATLLETKISLWAQGRVIAEPEPVQRATEGVERETEDDADVEVPKTPLPKASRRGKAPPIDSFTGENPEIAMDDWLPSLKWAAT